MSKWNKKEKEQQGASELKRKLAAQMEDEEYGAALGTVASMIEKGVKDAEAFYDAAYSYFMSGDYERATEWLDNTLRLDALHLLRQRLERRRRNFRRRALQLQEMRDGRIARADLLFLRRAVIAENLSDVLPVFRRKSRRIVLEHELEDRQSVR